ncbi:GGDEF domain-containing protein [Rugamonas rubra]|jgi:diguanylate cyclase (GGDEF)-like protein|uniref:diguanylate cyclase n=1 Tax=Rugamonas rubra TaxID=758825 RepID=A0A1I4TYM5_9BURK|nr:GGDEF domain-containing protein [Rugamonas rubra]SFM81854.1 diguanylate cyclase (GGDEF) domain-containing protein [Rugamonas rubra]
MDIKTLILALALGNLSLCAALFFFEYERSKRFGLSTWALAKQCQAAAWLLLYLRGSIPEVLSVPVANGLLFAGVALDAAALWGAVGRPVWRRFLLPALLVAQAAFVGAWLFDAPAPVRVAAGALIVAGFFLAGALALARRWRHNSLLQRFLAASMLALGLALALRGLLAAGLAPGAGPDGGFAAGLGAGLGETLLQWLGFGVLYMMMLVNAFGYLLLSRQRLQDQLDLLEVQDALTEVPNRRGFYQALAPWMALARRPGMPTALIILNLDHFKRVNDNYGHPVGDAVLKSMVEVCKKQLRDSDLMGRLGGAEFAVQLPRTSLADALMVAERIRNAVAAVPVKTERAVINLTASLGVTTIRAEDSTVSLFKRADEALQQAKRDGRNRVAEARAASPLEA